MAKKKTAAKKAAAKKSPSQGMLVVEARFYVHIADALWAGAKRALDAAGAQYDRITVPGALEIPAAIAMAVDAAQKRRKPYDGVVALGCVIEGETYHFEVVSNKSARGLMDLAIAQQLPIGNGILTVDTETQALVARQSGRRRQRRRRGARRAHHGRPQTRAGGTLMARGAPLSDKDAPKANRRGAARLAAVQALYQMDLAGTGLNEILAEFESHWLGREVEGAQYLPAEAAFFRDIVTGVVREQRALDPHHRRSLGQRLAAQAHRGNLARRSARGRL